ncbi:MAG: rRNA methyltransferase [Candidatus Lumbricidophila eiseniae]|uniref:rRNA methyltransferase n=1 Tax=Candidatus Lumbricidiphila eiseniae TaxID=1969409 RepID=A0A2A6FSH3_9MICO|nr:MAG: rRNA methyltransferase [Candidatus Lumbricidophila eiseniae]
MRVEQLEDVASSAVADFTNLTDVALRSACEPARGIYIAESAKVITRALAAGHQPRAVLCEAKWLPALAEVLEPHDVTVYLADSQQLELLTGYRVHRGALAVFERPELPSVATVLAEARLVVVLEDIVDHTNVGAIFRSVAGLGADAVLVTPRCADPLYRRSVRVSMGAVFSVPWTRCPEWDEAVIAFHAARFRLVACALTPEAVPLAEFVVDAPQRLALVLGTEGDGLSRTALRAADRVVRIPMQRGVDSLNVAAAAAVAVYALSGAQG